MSKKRKIKSNEIAFLEGLAKLTRETGVIVGGCGCCGSPFLGELTECDSGPEAGYWVSDEVDELTWVSKDSYDFKNKSEDLVR